MRLLVLSVLALTTTALDLHGCTLCQSDNSLQVRSVLFGEDFVRNLVFTLAPLAPMIGAVLLIGRGPRRLRRKKTTA